MSDLYITRHDSEFRLTSVRGDPQDAGFQIVRTLEKRHAGSADTIITSLNTKRLYATPTADMQTYAGTYISSSIEPVVDEADAVNVRQTLTKVRLTINESGATLFSIHGDPNRAGFQLKRGWKYVAPNNADTIIPVLNAKDTYGSPQADRQTYTGKFVNTSIEPTKSEDKSVTIYQTLTKVKATTDSADADLIEINGNPQVAGTQIHRVWQYIDPAAADTLYASMNAKKTYATGIKVDEQLYSGTFTVSKVQPVGEEDRTTSIHQWLTKSNTATDSASATLLATDGDPQWAGFKITRGWKNIAAASVDDRVVALNAVTTYDTGVKADSQKYAGKYIATWVKSDKQPDNTSTISQMVTKVRSTITGATAILFTADGDPERAGFKLKRGWKYVNPTTADTIVTALDNVDTYGSPQADAQTYAGSFVNSGVNPVKSEDRTVSIEQTLTKVKSAVDSADADLVEINGDPQKTGTKIHRAWHYIHPFYADAGYAALNAKKSYATGIKADEQLYSGTFTVTSVHPVAEEDRTITIHQWLKKSNTATDSGSAILFGTNGDPQWVGFQITRGWEDIAAASLDDRVIALNAITRYDTGVRADSQRYAGKFIVTQVQSKKDEENTGTITQLLTKVKQNADSSDADLLSIEGDPAVVGTTFRRAWHYIDPATLDTLFTTLNGIKTYAAGIKADGQLYSGKFTVSRVFPSIDKEDKTGTLEQVLKKVKGITSDTSLTNPLINREKEIIHPFGEGTGTGYRYVFRYINLDASADTKCMVFADTSLEKKMDAAKTYDLIDRKTQTEDDRTMTFYLLAEKKTRTAWTTTYYRTPTRIMFENRARSHEVRRKFYYGIKREHHDSVVGDLIDANSETGYRTITVTWQDDDNGCKDYIWTVVKSSSDTRRDSTLENVHGEEHLQIKRRHFTYNNYNAAGLPANPATDTYKFVQARTIKNAHGLLDKEVIHEKPYASNVVTAGVPARKIQGARNNPLAPSAIGNVGKTWEDVADRVPVRQADSVVRAWGTTDSGMVPTELRLQDYGDGSAKVMRVRTKVNTAGTPYWSQVQKSIGNYEASVTRIWPKVWDTKATALMETGGTAQRKATYGGDSYAHLRSIRTYHLDGTSDVQQILIIPSNTYRPDDGNGGGATDSLYSVKWSMRPKGTEKRVTTHFKSFTSETGATAWARASTYVAAWGYREGQVKSVGDGTYKAFRVSYGNP